MEIDVVVSWVDGRDPKHAEKRAKYISSGAKGEAYVPKRWMQDDEISYCLRSIGKFAPWVRRIWIVTDNQSPDVSNLDPHLRDRIEIVDHRVIFEGYEGCLPTFNSVSIETALHRIPGLAERFIYFNDDCLLLSPCQPDDFFSSDGVVIRGHFIDTFDRKGLHLKHKENAVRILGVASGHVFKSAHVCCPMLKSVITDFFDTNPGLFQENIGYRFRDGEQFLVSTLFDHLAIEKDLAYFESSKDCHMINAVNCPLGNVDAARRQMQKLLSFGIKLGCINNFSDLTMTYPEAISELESRLAPLTVPTDSTTS